MNMSEALRKNQDVVMPASIDIQLLPEKLQVDIKSENMISVFATRDENLLWDFIVDSEYIRGSGEFNEALDKHSRLNLNLERANLFALFKQEEQFGHSAMIRPATLPSLDVKIKNAQWDGRNLTDIDLVTRSKVDGMLIENINL